MLSPVPQLNHEYDAIGERFKCFWKLLYWKYSFYFSVENLSKVLLSVSKLVHFTLYSQSIRMLLLHLSLKYHPLAQVFLMFKFL